MADEKLESNDTPQPKKPFEPPRLQVYGDIVTLTRKLGRSGVSDRGVGSKNSTGP